MLLFPDFDDALFLDFEEDFLVDEDDFFVEDLVCEIPHEVETANTAMRTNAVDRIRLW